MARRLLLTVVLALGATTSPAEAGTLTSTLEQGSCHRSRCAPDVTRIAFTARAGEQNRLLVTYEGARLVIADPGAPIDPGPCSARSENEVVCSVQGPPPLHTAGRAVLLGRADLGDEDDAGELAATGTLAGGEGNDALVARNDGSLAGGEGDDVLVVQSGRSSLDGGPGVDSLTGGSRTDALTGGPGSDLLQAGDGDDVLYDGDLSTTAADVFDGGRGRDAISYAGRPDPLLIDLGQPGTVGAVGEGDELRSIEDATGGDGPDRVRGTERAEALGGGAGGDVIDAGGRRPARRREGPRPHRRGPGGRHGQRHLRRPGSSGARSRS